MTPILPNETRAEGWDREQKFVLAELQRLARAVESVDSTMRGDLTSMKIEIATLRTKWGVYATIIGAVAGALISAVVSYFFKR